MLYKKKYHHQSRLQEKVLISLINNNNNNFIAIPATKILENAQNAAEEMEEEFGSLGVPQKES